jgi:hypothetical protein
MRKVKEPLGSFFYINNLKLKGVPMKRFRHFIKESEESEITMADLNMEFINNALKVSAFNIPPTEFTKTDHKKEIQYLFNMHFFPKFDITKTIDVVDMGKLNTLISRLKSQNLDNFKKLHNYNLKGIGPGEVTLYFLINNAKLGGGASAGLDIMVGGKGYEVKAVSVSNDGSMAYDFKLGGTIALDEFKMDLNKLRIKLDVRGSATEIAPNDLKAMKQKAPAEFNAIEQRFAKSAYDNYFSKHEVIFINNSKYAKVGEIAAIKTIKQNEIFIYHVTSGTIKPKVKL